MKHLRLLFSLLWLVGVLVGIGGLSASAAPVYSPSEAVTRVQIESLAAGQQPNVPVTFGEVFAPGDIPAGFTVAAEDPNGLPFPVQVDAKATHTDGSLRHGILTAIPPSLSAGEVLTLTLSETGTGLAGTPVQLADLLATSFDASVEVALAGTSYTASARELLQAGLPSTWLSGPLVTEWLVAAPLKDSGNQLHPHLAARFHVRAYQGMQRVRVSVILENNWAYEPEPQNFTYDLTVSVDGRPDYTHYGLTHFSQARWRKSFWWGGEPVFQLRHERTYLLNSGAVPHFDPDLEIPVSVLDGLAAEWAADDTDPMDIGLPIAYMPAAGGRRDIGPLPSWAAHYLLSMDARAKTPTLGTGDLAGSWPIHYRDKNTGLPVSLVDYPYMTLLGNYGDTWNPAENRYEAFPSCGGDCSTPYSPDSAHQPSLAYIPYLVTGDYYYLEELQFWANWNLFRSNPYYREFTQGLFKSGQVRGQAWALRTLGNAAYITPDDHPLKAYFVDRVGYNLAWYNQEYTENPAANELGILTNGYALVYNNSRGLAPWQDDFFTWSVGGLADQGFTDAVPLLQWKGKFPLGRMVALGYCWIFGAIYSLNVRNSDSEPIFTTFAEAYDASVDPAVQGLPCAGQAMADHLGLLVGEMTGYAYSPEGYPSNMQPAMAVAAQAGLPGAYEAWLVFMNRTVKPDYAVEPNFAIVPRAVYPLTPRIYLPAAPN